jgi:hypothetical protein
MEPSWVMGDHERKAYNLLTKERKRLKVCLHEE